MFKLAITQTVWMLSFFFFLQGSLPAEENKKGNAAQVSSDEEAFLIRRIAEFWKDGDYSIVKTQILEFFDKFPQSQHKGFFYGILGDIYVQEKAFEKALNTYHQIKDPKTVEKILLNKLHCYYELDQFQQLTKEAAPYLTAKSEEIEGRKQELHFLLAEGFFRQALTEQDPQQKEALAKKAKPLYEKLAGTSYEETSQYAIAEIYAILGENEKAAGAYVALTVSHPEMKEDLLFQAATLQAHFDPAKAVDTFHQVVEIRGNRVKEATFNLAVLLYQTGRYEELAQKGESISSDIPAESRSTFDFILGKSFFALEDYKKSVDPMERFIDSQYVPGDQLKNGLLTQMTSAYKLTNEPLFNRSFEKFDMLFPKDVEMPKAIFMHAMLLKEEGASSRADERMQVIKEKYKEFSSQENVIFEYGLISHQNERWFDSYKTFKSYLKEYAESPRIASAKKIFLSSALNLYKQAEGKENASYKKEDFFQDLRTVLRSKECLNPQEITDFTFLYAKTAYELGNYVEALKILQDHIFSAVDKKEDPLVLAEAHFISGICFAEMHSDPSALAMHLEQALALNPELYDTSLTHLKLYNAYISLAGFGEQPTIARDKEQQKMLTDQAAEHLQNALAKGENSIKKENRLWLANHYYNKALNAPLTTDGQHHPEELLYIKHAIEQYENIFYKEGKLLSFTADTLYLENEALKFVKLLEMHKESEKKLNLLKGIIEEQSKHPELNWGSKREVLFELANAYKSLGQNQKAYETFHFISSSSKQFPSSIVNLSIFEAAKLHFDLLDEKLKVESNEEVIAILNDLKELQIRKNVASEPLHLEAALEYAEIRSKISKPEEKDERYLFFLKRIKDDFTSSEDPSSKEYLSHLKEQPEKKKIFNIYMKFVEAEMVRLEAKEMYKAERFSEMEEMQEKALSILGEIKNDRSTPKNLEPRINKSIASINALSAY